MLPALNARGPDRCRGCLLREDRLHARTDPARVYAPPPRPGCAVKLHAEQLSNMHGAALAAGISRAVGRPPGIRRRCGHRSHGPGGHGRGLVARRFLFPARYAAAAAGRAARRARSDGVGDRLQPGDFASDLTTHGDESRGHTVSDDRRGMPHRRDPRGRTGPRNSGPGRHVSKPASAATSPSGISNGRRSSSIAWVSIRCTRAYGGAHERAAPIANGCRYITAMRRSS